MSQAETIDQAANVPPEIAAIAASMDAELSGQASAVGGQLVADTGTNEAAEIAAMLCLAVKCGGYVEPAVPRYYTPEACNDIAGAYIECAEKYGWTWHKSLATGPEIKLAAAVGLPAFLIWQERQEAAKAAAEQAAHEARERARAASEPVTHGG